MIWKVSRCSARPAANRSAGSRLETSDRRTGALIALAADENATRAYSSQIERSPANACAASPAEAAALQPLVTRISLRRSTTSAIAPPSSPMVTVGTSCATPIAPTASGDRVMS